MRRILKSVWIMIFLLACGSPPSRPESLWDSLPPSPEPGGAKEVPAKVWEEEPDPASPDAGETGTSEADTGASGAPEEVAITGTVVLNEIYYDAVGSDTDGVLFIELYGTPGLPIGQFRVQLVDGGDGSVDDSIVLPDEATVGEDGFYLMVDAVTGDPSVSRIEGADLIDNFDPQNGPEGVQLIDSAGNLLDAVGYGEGGVEFSEKGVPLFEGIPAPDVEGGHSLERKGVGVDSNNNFNDFAEADPPTPRR